MAVIYETYAPGLIKAYSDEGFYIKNSDGEVYCEAIDPETMHRTYEETDEKIEVDEIHSDDFEEETNDIQEWQNPDSTNLYMTGDLVTHSGSTWMSNINDNIWEPGVYGWDVV